MNVVSPVLEVMMTTTSITGANQATGGSIGSFVNRDRAAR
jgi:hypothetical protein